MTFVLTQATAAPNNVHFDGTARQIVSVHAMHRRGGTSAIELEKANTRQSSHISRAKIASPQAASVRFRSLLADSAWAIDGEVSTRTTVVPDSLRRSAVATCKAASNCCSNRAPCAAAAMNRNERAGESLAPA